MTITFTIHMFLSELKDILTCLEDDGIRAMFTDSKAQYHHSIRKVKHVQATLLLHPSQWGQSLCGYLRAQILLHTFHQIIGFSGEIIAQQELFCMVMLLVNYHCLIANINLHTVRKEGEFFLLYLHCLTKERGRCRSTPVSTVLQKSVTFFIINMFLIIENPPFQVEILSE